MTNAAQILPLRSAMIIDDHPLFCDALSMTLKTITGIDEIETANHLGNALDMLEGVAPPDVIVLDLNLPDVSGLDGLIRLRGLVAHTPIVVVSSMADNRMISSVMRAGATGFVPKHSERAVFRMAFETIAAGKQFLPDGFVEVDDSDTPQSSQEDAVTRLTSLTNQQARILQLICAGKLNKQIAYDLGIAETTVKAHVTAIMRKLGVQSRTQAVLIANEASFANLLPNGTDGT